MRIFLIPVTARDNCGAEIIPHLIKIKIVNRPKTKEEVSKFWMHSVEMLMLLVTFVDWAKKFAMDTNKLTYGRTDVSVKIVI